MNILDKMIPFILDRSKSVQSLILPMLESWEYDLYARKPRAALLENGVFTHTDLDLACFMNALANRGAVINIPTYTGRRPKSVPKPGEFTVSQINRHGKILGLSANREVFSFSVRINDMNVIRSSSMSPTAGSSISPTAGSSGRAGQNHDSTDIVGAPRNFMLVDLEGEWYDGWSKIEFLPSAKENNFLSDRGLWTGNTIHFKNFVHPNRYLSFYSKHYLVTKLLIQRLEEENTWRRNEVKRMLSQGVRYPMSGEGYRDAEEGEEDSPTRAEPPAVGLNESIKVKAFECIVDATIRGEYFPTPNVSEELQSLSRTLHEVQYTFLPKLRFAVRATELAFCKAGATDLLTHNPFNGADWKHDVQLTGKRLKWSALPILIGDAHSQLRVRTYEKSERVRV